MEVTHIPLEEVTNESNVIPIPRSIAEHRHNPAFEGYGRGSIEIDITLYLGKTEKVNVTPPGHVIRQIDQYVTTHAMKSHSAFIVSAVLEKLTHAQ